MTFALGIVAHRDRLATAEKLAALTEADYMSVDEGNLGAGTNHRIVWRALLDAGATWSVVLEDDAVPVDGFREQLAQALAVAPAPIVSAYLGRQRPPQHQPRIASATEQADAQGASFILADHVLHAVALAIRTELVADMLANLRVMPIDQAIGVWARKRHHRVAYTWPSLVDHADTPTLINHPDGKDRPPGRVAWGVGTRQSWLSASVPL